MRRSDLWSGLTVAAPGHCRKSKRLSMGMGTLLLLLALFLARREELAAERRLTQLMQAMQQQTLLHGAMSCCSARMLAKT